MQPEMMPCVNSPELTILERQRTRLLGWQHEQGNALFQQQTSSFYSGGAAGGCSSLSFSLGSENLMGLGEVVNQCKMIDPSPEIEYWSQLGKMEVPSLVFGGGICTASSSAYEMSCGSVSRTSCPPTVAVAAERIGAPVGKDCFKKRKLERGRGAKGCEEDTRDKKLKGCSNEMESKITEQSNNKNNANKKESKNRNSINKETSASNSKDSSKASEVQKPDYIHVRARRGQATDSHSLAERVRREKISERMKFLQDLVPGCNKITGKAGMLDEIINYVQSLQRQVKFLSMKLATVNPRLDFGIDSLFSKECANGFPTIDMSSEQTNPSYLHCHPMQQLGSCSGLKMGINDPGIGLQRSATAPVAIPEPFIDSSCFAEMQPPATTWDLDFQNFCNMEFQQATGTAYQSHHQYIGPIEATKMKMEI